VELHENCTRFPPDRVTTLLSSGVCSDAVPFAVLFLTADAAFATIADSTPRPALGSVPGRLIAFSVVLLAALGLALAARKELADPKLLRSSRLTGIEWALPLVVLNLLFSTFVAVQLTALFAGQITSSERRG
jgi:hypothetical protein